MARLKTAKQSITDFLKAKGLDAAEIKSAFDELDAADVDLDKLADVTTKNQEWVNWYQQVTPTLQEIVSERDSLKQQIARAEAAGVRFGAEPAPEQKESQNNLPAFNPQEFQNNLTRATSELMKSLTRVSLRHSREYNEDPDLDAIEKVMNERGFRNVEDAYNVWVEPKRNERREKEVQDKIQRGIQEGIQAELSKQGVRRTRKRVDAVEAAPLDKPAPSDHDLRDAFIKDLDTEVTH